MIEQWLLYTNWRWIQIHGLPIWLPLRYVLKWTFWLLNSSCIFRSLKCDLRLSFFTKLYKNFISEYLSFIEINFDFQKVGRGSMWDYLHSQSTILLLFTEYLYPQSTTFINICFTMIPHSLLPAHSLLLLCNFYQHLLYHDTLFIDTSSFIASSMNELIKWAYPGQPMP